MLAMQTPLCECGCGQPTTLSRITDATRGYVKGLPNKFRRGHRKRRAGSYKRATPIGGGTELAHRQRAERALGRPLPRKAVVHHADGSRDPNSPLVICESQAYHKLLHARMRVKAAGGDPNRHKICRTCGQVKLQAAFGWRRSAYDGLNSRCVKCEREDGRKRRAA